MSAGLSAVNITRRGRARTLGRVPVISRALSCSREFARGECTLSHFHTVDRLLEGSAQSATVCCCASCFASTSFFLFCIVFVCFGTYPGTRFGRALLAVSFPRIGQVWLLKKWSLATLSICGVELYYRPAPVRSFFFLLWKRESGREREKQ